jgi:hypothetical protein
MSDTPREDAWHIAGLSEEQVAAQRLAEAERLAYGPDEKRAARLPDFPYPCGTPQELLDMPRDRMTGRLLDPEPKPADEEDFYKRDLRERRNFTAVREDRERFMAPPGSKYKRLFNQRWSQLVMDLRYPIQKGQRYFAIYTFDGPEHPWLRVPGRDVHEVENAYKEVCGFTPNPKYPSSFVVEPYVAAA